MEKNEPEISVMIVDDHTIARHGISSYIAVIDNMRVVSEAENGEDALESIAKLAEDNELPDCVLLDLIMPKLNGLETLSALRELYPDIRVVILTSDDNPRCLRSALGRGASGYLLKNAGPSELSSAIMAAMRGEMFIDSSLTRNLAGIANEPDDKFAVLTRRERTILGLVGDGKSNQQIASVLFISERTARTHVSNILRKLELESRTQAAVLAVQNGITSDLR